jgi:hypothetical protein
MRRSAAGETHAHLILLERHGLLRASASDGGATRWEAKAPPGAFADVVLDRRG